MNDHDKDVSKKKSSTDIRIDTEGPNPASIRINIHIENVDIVNFYGFPPSPEPETEAE